MRNIISWSESREVFNIEAEKIRAEFDANKHHAAGRVEYLLTPYTNFDLLADFIFIDSALVKRLVREAKERLAAQTHPDPYIQAYMPGGSLFMRNPAYPYELFYPDGIPEGVST